MIVVGDDAREACMAAFDNPDLAKCWLLMLLHEITPARFIGAVKLITHHSADAIDQARGMVHRCMGTPA